jgi:integral membrane protein
MAQLGEYARARKLLQRAARAFGPREQLERARCRAAEAEIAVAARDLRGPSRALDAAARSLAALGDHANALHARLVGVRLLLLLGRLDEACSAPPPVSPPLPAIAVHGANLPAPPGGPAPDPTALYLFAGTAAATCQDPWPTVQCTHTSRVVLRTLGEKYTVLKTSLGRLRAIGLIEGASYLVLLGVAMPLKYFAGLPTAVKVVGWLHGVLFILFCAALAHAFFAVRWSVGRAAAVFVAALLPFGTVVIDGRLKQEDAARRGRSRHRREGEIFLTAPLPGGASGNLLRMIGG